MVGSMVLCLPINNPKKGNTNFSSNHNTPEENKNKKSPFVVTDQKIIVLSLLCLKFTTTFWRKKKKSHSRIRTINRLFYGDFLTLTLRLVNFCVPTSSFLQTTWIVIKVVGWFSVENHRISKLKTATACCSIAH